MPSYTDDFNRANGYLGPNWVPSGGYYSIVSNRAVGYVGSFAHYVTPIGPGAHDVTISSPYLVGNDLRSGPVVKIDAGNTGGYYSRIIGSSGAYNIQIFRGGDTGQLVLQQYLPITFGPTFTHRLVYQAGFLYVYIDGVLRAESYDTFYDANTYAGMCSLSGATGIDTWTTTIPDAATFSVSPDSATTNGPPVPISFYGTGTAWTPGSPGAPTFTVSGGAITNQLVTSSGLASGYFVPPMASQTVIVTDPSTGLTDTIVVSGTVVPGGGGGFAPKLTDAGAALVNGTAANREGYILLEGTPIQISAEQIPIVSAVAQIWRALFYGEGGPIAMPNPIVYSMVLHLWQILNGGQDPPDLAWAITDGQPIKHDTQELRTRFDGLTAFGSVGLGDVINTLRGADDRDLTQVYNAVGSGGGGSSADVLAAIAAMRGPSEYDLDTVVGHLKDIRTPDLLTLGDVKAWIDALPRDWSTHLDTLAIEGSIAALALEIAGLYALEGEDAASSSAGAAAALEAAAITTLDLPLIIDMLGKIKDLLAPSVAARPAPPIWPGEANVTWGASIPIESNEPVVGRMHGVAVQIDGCQPGTRFFGYDGITNYSHVGALAFGTDRGDLEAFQAFGSVKGVYVPRYMSEAFTCRLYRSRNVRGTIRPWIITGA